MIGPERKICLSPLRLAKEGVLEELSFRLQLLMTEKIARTGKRDILSEFLIKAINSSSLLKKKQ